MIDIAALLGRASSFDPPIEEGSTDVHIARLIHELQVHHAELELHNAQLRRAEQELEASRNRYRSLYHQAPVGYLTLDAMGRITDANRTLARLLGCARAWLLGRPLSSLMSEAHADVLHLHLRDLLGGNAPGACEVELRHVRGTALRVRLQSSPCEGALAESGKVLTAVVDLTDLRRAEEDARRSESQARTLFDTAVDGILSVDAEGRMEAVNAAARRLFGYEEAELLGRSVRVLLPPSSAAQRCVERFLATGQCERGESGTVAVVGRRRDGAEIPLEVGLGSWQDRGGPKLHVLLRDVSERRLAEQRLQQSEARLRDIATHVDDVLYVQETDGRLSYVSPAYARIWGRPPSEVVSGPGWFDSIDVIDKEVVEQARRRLQHGEPIDVEYRISRPDGTNRWIRDHASPVRDATGTILRHVGVARDITEARRLADDQQQTSKMEAIDTLAAGIAHDFRNLLHGIAGCAVVAERELAAHGPVAAYLQQIHDATRRGTALTDQLMAFSRREEADRPRPIAIDAFLKGSAPLLRGLVGEQIRVDLRLEAPLATVMADPVQLERILMNLASNASDAMPEGGVLVIRTDAVTLDEGDSLREGLGIVGPCVRLEVRDTGTGIDAATRERIFEPFFTTKDVGKGTGLGLSAVFGITRKLGGRIAVDSTPGVGTAFTFWLPRCADASTHEPTGPRAAPSLAGLALLVEDDRLVRASIRADLEQLGMQVVEADDPRGALAVIDTLPSPPVLLVTDVMMPYMTGPRLAEQLRARIPRLEVLLVSAHAAADLIARGTLPPGSRLLRKPFDQAELAQHVLEVLGSTGATRPDRMDSAILLVDDDDGGRELLAMLLEHQGHHVLAAEDAEVALELAAAHAGPIGLLITDVGLPGMSGDELARRLRAQRPAVEVLFVSGSPPTPAVAKEGESMLKPVDFGQLVARVRRLLGRGSPSHLTQEINENK